MTDLLLEGEEADVYLACDDGARLATICRHTGCSTGTVLSVLDKLIEEKLVLREGDHFLGLAVPARPAPGDGRSRSCRRGGGAGALTAQSSASRRRPLNEGVKKYPPARGTTNPAPPPAGSGPMKRSPRPGPTGRKASRSQLFITNSNCSSIDA